MSKAKKVKTTPIPPLESYVLNISNLIGYDEEKNCLLLKSGYAMAVRIPGIDIMNFKPADKEFVFSSFGAATQMIDCPIKYIILSDKSDYTEQIDWLTQKMKVQAHPYCRYLLERQIAWLKSYENAQSDRLAYGMLFDKDVEQLKYNVNIYLQIMHNGKTVPVLCDKNDYKRIFQILLQGGTIS